MFRKMIQLCVLAAVALAISASSAKAAYVINMGNTDVSPYPGPYATASVVLNNSTTATITFTGNLVGGYQYLFGSKDAVVVNVNASSWTIGSFSASNSGTGFSPGPLSDDGSSNVGGGFGTFNQSVKSFDGYTSSSDTISFVLTRTDSGSWASDASVLTANSDGFTVGAHIFVTSAPADASNKALATGFAVNGGGQDIPGVPAPPALILLASAVPVLALRRFRRKVAA